MFYCDPWYSVSSFIFNPLYIYDQWATVCVKLPHCTLKSVCGSLMEELKRQHEKVPGLPVASAVFERWV